MYPSEYAKYRVYARAVYSLSHSFPDEQLHTYFCPTLYFYVTFTFLEEEAEHTLGRMT